MTELTFSVIINFIKSSLGAISLVNAGGLSRWRSFFFLFFLLLFFFLTPRISIEQ
jgi:hypothetical protein